MDIPLSLRRIMETSIQNDRCPSSVPLLIVYQCLEKFVFYGLKSGLLMFLHQNLLFDEKASVTTFHLLMMLYYFSSFAETFLESCIPSFWWNLLWVRASFNREPLICRLCFLLNLLYIAGAAFLLVCELYGRELGAPIFLTAYALVMFAAGAVKPSILRLAGSQFKFRHFSNTFSQFVIVSYICMNFMALTVAVLEPTILRTLGSCEMCHAVPFLVFTLTITLGCVIVLLGFSCFDGKEAKTKYILGSVVGCLIVRTEL